MKTSGLKFAVLAAAMATVSTPPAPMRNERKRDRPNWFKRAAKAR